MCDAPEIKAPPPPPAPPVVLEQAAPKFQKNASADAKRVGLSRYKAKSSTTRTATNKLGGIPTKTGV